MARLTDAQRENIKNALLLGDSQYKVAQDFNISSATVNKIYKSIDEKTLLEVKDIVKEEVAIKSTLSNQSESFVKAFEDKVNEQLRLKNLVFKATEKIIKKATDIIDSGKVTDKLNIGDGVQQFEPRELNTTDVKNLADAIDKASITLGINQRHSNSQINVNTQNNLEQNNNNITVEWD
ncbi:hypothetical protein QUR76_06850 [Arcobacter cryaerophilus gv. pseudocryaerophilus]|uniref:Uncharacterized protein n=3 Tax=unclassified Arcobacter TaxID=2593671 RepID=A0AA96DFQ7_9BACT|nr:hypothetical protein RMQ65_01245 [Arcobacter sp. AZ-2023]WPD04844.1 hypothetical protein QUR76_06850 [Arcobacter sp. DSM 115956]WPD06939.1 hypothetical protein QUR78_06850 [Arcobacter sp. DSM 115955]WNL31204.1 hypothetical protein RMQ67_06850 [Arcobacter sp. AZ-2023]WNP37354.1 hypothetical protein RJG58_06850 [Arcobacter sp. AZ-2023]